MSPGPVHIAVDPAHGGRWTSLRAGGREWLWHRHAPGRATVSPGDAFVDAGGLEECVPTVRGTPDHGDAWSRPWTADQYGSGTGAGAGTSDGNGTWTVHCDRFALARTIRAAATGAEVHYVLTADPGFRFVWAAHALLDLSGAAVLRAPHGARTRLFPEAAALLDRPWPAGADRLEGTWPQPHGLPLGRFGPRDGTAVGAVVDTARCCVHDGPDRLAFTLECEAQPRSVALWRNLGGFPAGRPYRSTGVEPMLGRVFDLAEAGPGDAARVPASGEVRWRLTLAAECRCAPTDL